MNTEQVSEAEKVRDGVLVIVNEALGAASFVVQMDRSKPRRFGTVEFDSDGARLRRNDGVPVKVDCERHVMEKAAACPVIVVKEIDLETGNSEEYPINLVAPEAAPGIAP